MEELTSVTTNKKDNSLSLNDFFIKPNSTIKAPLFLIFAGYLGFSSKVIDWAEDWLRKGNETEEYKVKIIETDSVCLLNQIKNKYSREELSKYYSEFTKLLKEIYKK